MQPVLPKKMLYIHIRNMHVNPHLYFESEDYFFDGDRRVYAENIFETFNKDEALQNIQAIDYLGFNLLTTLLHQHRLRDRQGRQWALLAYTDHDRLSIDMDEEPYRANHDRHCCAFLPLKSLFKEDTLYDDSMRMRVGRVIVQNLL